ncbi:MAG TPA: pentapeptide repeat-containing protein [Tessaracoccus flavescens]|uniref:Pentapeptide repeat-containing protein n=1 Tax=Tessaracoccus flavescens TaxID=399497 RepID=A0A921EPL0_9ACTN|nr:pentapeptide repeat-containing protein [Tessaracoccus flavescens]
MDLIELLDDRDYLSGEEIRGAHLEPVRTVRGVTFEACTFVGCVFDEGIFRSCEFIDCRFDSCSLSMTKLISTEFNDCVFTDCKAMSVNWTQIRPNQVGAAPLTFEGCKLSYGSFNGVNLRGWSFKRCELVDADFSEAKAQGVNLIECDLKQARFINADLRGVDLRSSYNYFFDVRDNRVAGLQVTLDGGANLLRAFGIAVD